MVEGQGKSKRRVSQPEEVEPANGLRSDQDPSLASRVAASASGLAKDLVGSSSANGYSKTLSSATGMNGKVQDTSRAGPSTWSENVPSRAGPSSSAASGFDRRGGIGESFRSQTSGQNVDQVMQEFFDETAVTDRAVPLSAHMNIGNSWTADFQRSSQPQSVPQRLRASGLHEAPINSHGTQYDDGAEVRQLLSDPSFIMATDTFDVMSEEPTQDTVNDLFGTGMTGEEAAIANKIKSSLPAPPVHNPMPRDHPLNLRPEFASMSLTNPNLEQELYELSTTMNATEDGFMYFANTPERQHWLADWDDVLNGYTDEVWGDLLPTVKAAREKIEEAKGTRDTLDSKTVTRLKMILGHVVQSSEATTAGVTNHTTGRQNGTATVNLTNQATSQRNGVDITNHEQVRQLDKHWSQYDQAVMGERLQYTRHYRPQPSFEQMGQQGMIPPRQDHMYQRPSYKRQVPVDASEEKEEFARPAFRCPWRTCHESFNSMTDMQMHAGEHSPVPCPHTNCPEIFTEAEKWSDHIQKAHHDLLETPPALDLGEEEV